ncbi:MAB_1171c family putative transporter [Streptomyces sp. NPDC091266]|uniref:MAB_1171c family putative transporter n=1 Tax=Streptomyces sp. NPDC091266 TaxID=3365978 RepID=UPI003829E736
MLAAWQMFVAIQMTAVTLWRLPALRYGDTLRRSLWGCSAGFAAALWVRFAPLKELLDNGPIVDLSQLLKHLFSLAALLSLLQFTSDSYGNSAKTARHVQVTHRIAHLARRAAYIATPVLIVSFFVVDRDKASGDFLARHADEVAARVHMTVFYAYLATVSLVVAHQWARSSRVATGPLRPALAVLSTGLAIYVAYPVLRLLYMWTDWGHGATSFKYFVGTASDVANLAVGMFFAIGFSLPTTTAPATYVTNWRLVHRIRPLWRDLMRSFPEISFFPPTSRFREALEIATPVDVRLDRHIQEIGDAVAALRLHAPVQLWTVAVDATEGHQDPRPAAEALWIAAALRSAKTGYRAPQLGPGVPDKPISDSRAEAWWWVRVEAAYETFAKQEVADVLAVAQGSVEAAG